MIVIVLLGIIIQMGLIYVQMQIGLPFQKPVKSLLGGLAVVQIEGLQIFRFLKCFQAVIGQRNFNKM